MAGDDQQRAEQRGDRVQLTLQHARHLHHQHIAHDAAADAGEDAEHHRADRPDAVLQRLARADHREQPKPDRIRQLHRIAQAFDGVIAEERDQAGGGGDGEIGRIHQRHRRRRAEQDIAGDAAGRGRGEGQHQHAEQVQSLAHAGGRAADREGEGAEVVDRGDEARGHAPFSVAWPFEARPVHAAHGGPDTVARKRHAAQPDASA